MASQPVRRRSAAVIGALAVLALTSCDDGPSGKDGRFTEGREMVLVGRYEAAIPVLRDYLTENPQGKNASRAGLFLGKAHLGLGDLVTARQVFERTARQYAGTLEAHKSRYKLALLDFLEDRPAEALAGFEKLAERPDGSLAPEALAMSRFLQRRRE